jgi:putative two-component system response regulator
MSSTNGLEILLRRPDSAASPEVKTELSRLSAELKTRLARGSIESCDFFTGALATLAKLKGTRHFELRLGCLLDCAIFFYTSGYRESAIEAGRQLVVLSGRSKNKHWIRKANSVNGAVNADAGDISAALVSFTLALAIAKELNDQEAEMTVLNNLGSALSYGGLPDEAMRCFQRVASVDRSSSELKIQAANALCNIAQMHLYNEDYGRGFEAIVSSLALADEPNDAASALGRTIREFTYVQLALGLRQFGLARTHVELCRRFSHWGDSKRSEFIASVAEGLFEVHVGDVSEGLSRLERAFATTTENAHPRLTCLTALVKGCDEAGRPEEALQYMQQLLEHVRATRERSVLALMEMQGCPTSSWAHPADLRTHILERRELKLRALVAAREVLSSRIEMLERLAVTADLKEEASGEHGYRVGKLERLMAEDLGWTNDAAVAMEFAARLHDLGKLVVPDRILLSSQTLKDAERHFMSTHAVIGAELLAKSNIPQLRMAEDIARYHHEWWNGNGYSARLAGKRIPVHARVVALADVFDALTHGRPYAEPWPMDRAVEQIRSRRGTQFDPELTDLFLGLIQRLRAEHEDLDAYLGSAGRNSPFLQARNKIRQMLAEEQENERKATVSGNETRH